MVELVKEGYLTAKYQLTSKYLAASQASFCMELLSVGLQRNALYDCLSKYQTSFDSTIAKLELISLKKELKNLGHELKILQIYRKDYRSEDVMKECEAPVDLKQDLDSLPVLDGKSWKRRWRSWEREHRFPLMVEDTT